MDYLILRRREFETTLQGLAGVPRRSRRSMRPAEPSRAPQAAELAMTLANEERVMTNL